MRTSYARCATARALQKAHHQGNSDLQLLSKELDSGDYTMKPGQGSMFGFSSVKRITLREGLY